MGIVAAMLIFNGCAMAGMPFVSDLWLLGVIARANLTGYQNRRKGPFSSEALYLTSKVRLNLEWT